MTSSYVHIVKGGSQSVNGEAESFPALVLDEDCCNSKDLDCALFGRVKEFASLANLKMVLKNEGFDNITIKYMGGFWVLLEFTAEDSKKSFQSHMGAASWFTQLVQASMDFNIDERVAWVEIEGVPFKMWSANTFRRIASKWGTLIHVDGQDEECFHRKRLCLNTKVGRNIVESFKIIFKGKVYWIRANEVPGWVPDFMDDSEEESDTDGDTNSEGPIGEDDYKCGNESKKNTKDDKGDKSDNSIKYPPGFTPVNVTDGNEKKDESNKDSGDFIQSKEGEEANVGTIQNGSKKRIIDDTMESVCSGHFKKSEAPRTGGSILNLMDELVKVGQTMGYNMEGCLAQKAKKDWVKELCIRNKVNFLALQETKMEDIELLSVKMCWGNFAFDYVHSASVGNSGGILCVWDPSSFRKINATVSDYFVMIRGVWLKNGKDMLVVSVYAPQELNEKRILWDYLEYVINNWKGEVVVMGDFNEVRNKTERFGSKFNVQGALKRSPQKIHGLTTSQITNIYRRYWKIVEKEVVEAVIYFFSHGSFPKGSNSAFIALIPKTPDANMVKDFRPISLIGSLYKIIAKILANHLVVVLGDIVNDVQSAFVADRQILDGPFISNELLQWCKKKKKQSLIFKVDFEKAYDSVRWDFLDDVTRKFSFGKKWCHWIQNCLRSSRGSIIINGSPTEEFQFYKGLKQGDPLSPFLFLLVMESLHISFQRVVDAGMFKG
ncbi:RNA-directed DNA polymerase, eukaryota, reverse transcriptase zinc-binding domain protein, partial [Tanacetum coccineum]